MIENRKDIRFQLPAASVPDFEAAKRKAEQELGVVMSNNEFARRVVVQAVKDHDDSKHDMQGLVDLLAKDIAVGGEFARQYEKTYGIKRRGK